MEIRVINATLINLLEFDQIPFTKLLVGSNLKNIQEHFAFKNIEVRQKPDGQSAIVLQGGLYNQDTIVKRVEVGERKITIEVEEKSAIAKKVFDSLKELLRELSKTDDETYLSPVVQTVESIIIAKMNFHATSLIHPQFNKFINSTVESATSDEQKQAITSIFGISFRIDYFAQGEFARKLKDSLVTLSRKDFTIGPRDGTALDEKIFISKAPLDTEVHITLLEEIETIFT
ncbi:MAG: hypothetical protein KKD28_08565 [Chloroflexi bacterium]|nr:hypothetical protein [Chloroflexota bacterium]MBU1661512.1 hypothetical protein [Chloroflexota bacterium]